jgi:hypothetical protein
MTILCAIKIAKKAIKLNQAYVARILKYDEENPDTSENQLGIRMSNLVITLVEEENELLCEIISQIEPKK